MPHVTSMPACGIQAIILCGPGVSLNTFTSNPEDFPKALVPIANRPMVWYPLDWCYRMGITTIHLVTPPSSTKALDAALSQNPHLTALPHPKADIIAPAALSHTTGTAEILRMPEVRATIKGDFLVLPCDILCEMPGESLIESWMVQQDPLGGTSSRSQSLGGGTTANKGGLGIWFETKGHDYVKGAETDFLITAAVSKPVVPPAPASLRPNISKLLYTSTTDTLRDTMQEKPGLPLRTGLLRSHGKIQVLTTYRAAHVYLFPYWILEVIRQNEKFDSISEDAIGWWAKASWQDGLAGKLHIDEAAQNSRPHHATKLTLPGNHGNLISTSGRTNKSIGDRGGKAPSILSYIHPQASPFLIRRVDGPALLLSTSLHIAAMPPLIGAPPDSAPTPFSHKHKISRDSSVAPHTTIQESTTLIAPNTTVETHCTVKSSCIGANCAISQGAKITGSLLMDGVTIESKVSLQGCILGRRCVIGKGTKLEDCEVQEGFKVTEGTIGAKGEKFSAFEGLENGLDGIESKGLDGDENP